MYDTTLGRFLQRDRAGFISGMDVYQYALGNPLEWRDPLGLLTDAAYESRYGLTPAIARGGSMSPVGSVMGSTFVARGCTNGRTAEGCDVRFTFDKAYVGSYVYSQTNKATYGAYVKISVSLDPQKCCDCEQLRLIQIVRFTRMVGTELETVAPDTAIRRKRAGWDSNDAPSRGWMIDKPDVGNSAFLDLPSSNPNTNSVTGENGGPAILRDAPGVSGVGAATDTGRDFYTCAICVNGRNPGRVLACVHWGFYVLGQTVSFVPATPEASCQVPPEFEHALNRWESLPGKLNTNLERE
jgi:hypothetical protein